MTEMINGGIVIRNTIIKLIVFIVLSVSILAAGGEYVDRCFHEIGMRTIIDSNQHYLQQSFDRATAGFLVLSVIKSGLAVIEGSQIGVGFNLELGDIVQSLYDYVDIAWKTVLAGGTILMLTRLTLDAVAAIDHYFLSVTLFFFLMYMMVKWILPKAIQISRFLREAVLFLIVITMSLYFILPLSIKAASFLSAKISQPLIQETQASFAQIKEEFSPGGIQKKLFSGQNLKEKNWYSAMNFSENLERVKQRFTALQEYFAERTKQVSVWTIKLIAGYLFDCIIFPLTFLVVLYVVTKGMIQYCFGISRGASVKEDMEYLLIKYYGKPVDSKGLEREVS